MTDSTFNESRAGLNVLAALRCASAGLPGLAAEIMDAAPGQPFRGLHMRETAEALAPVLQIPTHILAGEPSREAYEAARARDRYLATVVAALEDDARLNVQRAAAGLPLVASVVLTPEQSAALHAGSLDLADALPPDPWWEVLGLSGEDYAVRLSEAATGEWERLSDFAIRRKLYYPGRCECDRWRRRRVPEEAKRRADRRRSDRKRRAARKAVRRRA